VAQARASLKAYASIATQPIYGATGKPEWVPADCLVRLELTPAFDRGTFVDARLPVKHDRTGLFGEFKNFSNGNIGYIRDEHGLFGAGMELTVVTWSEKQRLLAESVRVGHMDKRIRVYMCVYVCVRVCVCVCVCVCEGLLFGRLFYCTFSFFI
jgi:hypothetical protein